MASCFTHEHGDHVCGLEVLCRKFDVPIYCNALTAEAIRCDSSFDRHRNWRIFRTGAEFSICDVTVQTFPVPHDAVDPLGFVFHAGSGSLGFITDLGYATKIDRRTLAPGANARDRDQSRRKTFAERHASAVAGETTDPIAARSSVEHGGRERDRGIVAGKIERVVLGHLSRDCNTPALALETVRAALGKMRQDRHGNPLRHANSKSVRDFESAKPKPGPFQPTFENAFFQTSR